LKPCLVTNDRKGWPEPMKPGRVLRHDQERMLAAIRNLFSCSQFCSCPGSGPACQLKSHWFPCGKLLLADASVAICSRLLEAAARAATDSRTGVIRAEISRGTDVLAPGPLNFKTPRHATASTTMLHFGVYVAVPRGAKTDFDSIRMGLFT
jgi:hypothetical protein